jgi:hypothetical protein
MTNIGRWCWEKVVRSKRAAGRTRRLGCCENGWGATHASRDINQKIISFLLSSIRRATVDKFCEPRLHLLESGPRQVGLRPTSRAARVGTSAAARPLRFDCFGCAPSWLHKLFRLPHSRLPNPLRRSLRSVCLTAYILSFHLLQSPFN